MTLYEIDQAIIDCLDTETGEILDAERLEELNMARDQKLENVACYIKNLLSDAAAIKVEKDALAEREAWCRKRADKLSAWLADALQGAKFSTAKCAVSFRRSVSVDVEDVQRIPAEFLRVKTTYEPDKSAIKAAIQTGHEINGCRLVERLNTKII